MIVDMHQQANPFFSSKNLPFTTKHGRLTFSPLILLIIGVTFSIIIIIISSYNAFSIVVLLFSLIGISLLVLTNSKRLSFIVVILYLLAITLL